MFRTALLAAVVPLALGSEYSYTYDYTDAPTAAPIKILGEIDIWASRSSRSRRRKM